MKGHRQEISNSSVEGGREGTRRSVLAVLWERGRKREGEKKKLEKKTRMLVGTPFKKESGRAGGSNEGRG